MLNKIKNILKFTLVFFLATTTVNSQTLSDEEIGFDENHLREILNEEGATPNEIEEKILVERNILTNTYLGNSTENLILNPQLCTTSSSCDTNTLTNNIGFEQNSFNNWCRQLGVFNGYYKSIGYKKEYSQEIFCDNQEILDDVKNDSGTIICNINRFEIVDLNHSDPFIDMNFRNINSNEFGNYALKIGNACDEQRIDKIEKKIKISENNTVLRYAFAAVFEDTSICGHVKYEDITTEECNNGNPEPNHPILNHQKPYLQIYIKDSNGIKIDCSELTIYGDYRLYNLERKSADISDDDTGRFTALIQKWTTNSINLLDIDENIGINDEITLVVETADCSLGQHIGYAYFDAYLTNTIPNDNIILSASDNSICVGESVSFSAQGAENGYYSWSIYNQTTGKYYSANSSSNTEMTMSFQDTGFYTITHTKPRIVVDNNCTKEAEINQLYVDVENCGGTDDSCEGCDSFSPDPKKTYWLGAWVKERVIKQVRTYNNSAVVLLFSDKDNKEVPNSKIEFKPSGGIIDGWQRILGKFKIPEGAVFLNIELLNLSTGDVFFDDVRVHPYNSNMKSFAYDSETYRLMSELDENNFATFYEYDNEGGLVRVKKETERGVYTIQETRSKSHEKAAE